jgi:hypothetical protein
MSEKGSKQSMRTTFRRTLTTMILATMLAAPASLAAQRKDQTPFRSTVYNVTFSYPRKDWVAVPAAGGNIALVMHRKGEASLALDYTVLRVALEADEIDETFEAIEVEALTQRSPHARVTGSERTEINGHPVIIIRYGAAGLAGDLDVTQYSFVEGAGLYRLTCALARAQASRHATVCADAAQSLVIGGAPS